jgi:hypothetical protein
VTLLPVTGLFYLTTLVLDGYNCDSCGTKIFFFNVLLKKETKTQISSKIIVSLHTKYAITKTVLTKCARARPWVTLATVELLLIHKTVFFFFFDFQGKSFIDTRAAAVIAPQWQRVMWDLP